MALTALEIYKLLPRTNCRDCGLPTCLAFAMQMVAGKAGVDKCPHVSAEAGEVLGAAAAPPLPRVVAGSGERAVTMGEEVVLYRHEKTFYHPTALAVSISDALDEAPLMERVRAIGKLAFERVGQRIAVDLAAIRCDSGEPARFTRTARAAQAGCGLPLVLIGPPAALASAVQEVGRSRPVLWPPQDQMEEGARIAAAANLPLVASGAGLDGLLQALAAARAAGARDLIGNVCPATVADAVSAATSIRRLAIVHRAREIACPTAFDLGQGFPSPFAAACLLIPKYGSLLVLDAADPAEMLPLLTLRQNIFTDPQQPIQVEPDIYPIGKPDAYSPVLITTNFSLTFFTVRGDVEASKVPAHLLVAECDGMSVLTAWAAGKFTAESIAKMLTGCGIQEKVSHRTLIVPGMVARLSGKTEELSGWKVLVGPQESSALPAYLRRLPPAAFAPVNG